MRRSTNRRAATRRRLDRRILAAAGAIVVFGAIAGVTQISRADETPTASTKADKQVNGLTILTDTCEDSTLEPHDGFQKGDRCVSTEFGEVGSAKNNPSLLITDAPRSVTANTPFTLKVSTRNLIRDRFLAAGQGGYYVESSVLQDGIVRGHFHTACRMLGGTDVAPAPEPVPAFFVATEDSKGGRTPDTVTINVPGLPSAGIAQCASWAGDGSHRIPMMERANQTPALDAVRITVRAGDNNATPPPTTGATPPPTTGATPPPTTGATPPPTTGATAPPTTKPAASGGTNTGGTNTGGTNTGSTTTGGTNTKGTIVKNTPPPTRSTSTSTSTKPSTSKSTSGTSTGGDQDETATEENATSGDDEEPNSTTTKSGTTKKSTTSKSTKTTTSGTESADTSDDGATLDQNAQPDADSQQVTDAAPKAADKSSRLALTGTNTVMVLGIGAILLIVGLVIFSGTRRRPRGYR